MTSRERRGTRYLVRLMRKRGCVSMGDVAAAAWRANAGGLRASDCDGMLHRLRRHGGRIMPGYYGVLLLTERAYQGRIVTLEVP